MLAARLAVDLARDSRRPPWSARTCDMTTSWPASAWADVVGVTAIQRSEADDEDERREAQPPRRRGGEADAIIERRRGGRPGNQVCARRPGTCGQSRCLEHNKATTLPRRLVGADDL